MNSEACRDCIASKTSPEKVIEILLNQPSQCKNCAHQDVIRVVANKFRTRLHKWWVINGTVIVPIWIVESIKRRLGH
jgi:hypothetical protein